MGMRRWEYTSDETGACVNALAERVVRHVSTKSDTKVRVDVRRGDGRGLVRMLREGLPQGVAIDDNASSPSMKSLSAKLDVSVHVASDVWGLCNVAKVAEPLTPLTKQLKMYAAWVRSNLELIKARSTEILPAPAIGAIAISVIANVFYIGADVYIHTLLGYQLDRSDWDKSYATAIRDAVNNKIVVLDTADGYCADTLSDATNPEDKDLFGTFRLALAAGISAAAVILTRANKALAQIED
jgi:hypothetical protein